MSGKPLRVEVRFRNARLYNAIFSKYESVNHFCAANGFQASLVGEFLNLKRSPLKSDGEYSKSAINIAEALFIEVEDLFPLHIYKLDKTSGAVDIEPSYKKIENQPDKLLLSDHSKEIISNVLSSLPSRQSEVLRGRYWEGLTLEDVGNRMGITKERVRQIENKALKKMRSRHSAELRVALEEMNAGV